jgi:hypothetical protein
MRKTSPTLVASGDKIVWIFGVFRPAFPHFDPLKIIEKSKDWNVREMRLDLIRMGFAKYKYFLDARNGQKFQRVFNQRNIGQRQQALKPLD